jgi:hypothetical protein
MRRAVTLAAAALMVAGIATACGGAQRQTLISGKSAYQVASLGSDGLTRSSFRFSVVGRFGVDTSGLRGVPAATQQSLQSTLSGLRDVNATGEAESSHRVSETGTVGGHQVHVVIYDGTFFTSLDGTHWASSDQLKQLLGSLDLGSTDIRNLVGQSSAITDVGPDTVGGVATQHLHATLDQSYLSKSLDKVFGSSASQLGDLVRTLLPAVHLDRGSVDEWVDADAHIRRQVSDAQISMDIGKLFTAIEQQLGQTLPPGQTPPGGTYVMSIHATVDYRDFGAKITVTKPTVDPNAPALWQILQQLSGGSSSATP